ncbi:type II toxin-antitoxin system VapC family toxin [Rhizobium mayense]|uniref:Type II toxin-antitoxin system VapC family toxin n=1 Tax=Rhizobium mayense TaxID=1312184 RepID=A0ABT7JXH1_9HYPH|nr:type II toxin-antitoxin system VapC family toxin [Rhizobium mayense]MDL2400473.1 type II toxin-antitoxin system VapC family toxin [Rhizobium mayense]
MYLLDTNVISELRKLSNGKTDPIFARWFDTIPLDILYASVITLFEIENGILLLERRDPLQAKILRDWFDKVKAVLHGRVLSVDEAVAMHCAAAFIPNPRPWRDAFIGSTAAVHRFTLVTRNVRDFQGLYINIINPWVEGS